MRWLLGSKTYSHTASKGALTWELGSCSKDGLLTPRFSSQKVHGRAISTWLAVKTQRQSWNRIGIPGSQRTIGIGWRRGVSTQPEYRSGSPKFSQRYDTDDYQIGYYHICGADRTVLDGTDFYPYYNVYVGAWARIIRAIENAARRGIGVLLDLHAAPGKQNDDAHAGTSDRANFFNDPHNQTCTVHALRVLVNNIVSRRGDHQPPLLNVVGVELINEPRPPSDHALQSWYTFAMHELRSLDSKIPIYLGDCWRTEFYANYLVDKHPSALTVLDHHLYRCFTESDIRTSAESHTLSLADPNAETPVMLARAAEKLGRVGCGIVIGEWSGALNPGSLRGGTKEKEDYVRAQLDLFEEHCGGWFFWTYKKQDRGDTGWSLRDAVQAGIFPPSVGLKAKRSAIGDEGRWREARDGQKQRSLREHLVCFRVVFVKIYTKCSMLSIGRNWEFPSTSFLKLDSVTGGMTLICSSILNPTRLP